MLPQHQIIYLAALLMDMAVAGVTFAISRRAAELGASAAQLGWLGAVWIGVYAACALVTGRFSDRVGRRRMAITGCVVVATMTLACSQTVRVGWLLLFSGILGAGLSCFWPAVIAWLGEGLTGQKLAARLTVFGVAWNIGLLTGFALTGVLFKHGPRLAFYLPAAATILIAVLLSLPGKLAPLPAEPLAGSGTDASPPPKGRGFRKTAWLANFAMAFVGGGSGALFPQLATHLGIGPDVNGGLFAAGRAGALVTIVLLQVLTFWHVRLWPLWVAQFCAVLSLVWIGFANATWMFAVAIIVGGLVGGFTYQASIYFTLDEMSEKGKGSGFHEAMIGGGMFLGPVLAGWVGSHHSLRSPYFFCAGVLVVLIVAQMVLVFVRRHATVPA
jgi:MFS family permease